MNKKASSLSEMAMGNAPKPHMEFPISQPLANMVSLIDGDALRSEFLNWIFSDGLVEASLNRDKLRDLVNENLLKSFGPDTVRFNPPPRVTAPTQKVVNLMKKESLEPYGVQARNPYNPKDTSFQKVESGDLFSPEAWEQRPELRNVKIDGLGILEYYNQNLEPKEATTKDYVFDLNQMRATLQKFNQGIKPFRYGGFDGYIQFVEKGDYLSPVERRNANPENQQFGPDLQVDKTRDQATGQPNPNPVSVTDHGPTVNFVGGSFTPHVGRGVGTINQMRGQFAKSMQGIENGEAPEDLDVYKQLLLATKELEKREIGYNAKGTGSKRIAAQLGIKKGQKDITGEAPANIDPRLYETKIREGLKIPRVSKMHSWANPSVFGPEWNGQGPEPDGWHRIENNKIIYRFNSKQIESIMQYVTKDLPRTGKYNQIINFGHNVTKNHPLFKDTIAPAGPIKNTRLDITTIFSSAVKANPQDQEGMKVALYHMKGKHPKGPLDASQFSFERAVEKIEVDPTDKQDEIISNLKSKGYQFKANSKTPGEIDVITMVHRGDSLHKYVIKRDSASKTGWFLYVPTGARGKGVRPPDYGHETGAAWLGSDNNIRLKGGAGGGHIKHTIASPILYNRLIEGLKRGEFGEPLKDGVPYNDIHEFPSIIEGASMGVNYINRNKAQYKKERLNYRDVLYEAAEGLKAFSGDIAFQIGYISDEELTQILNFDAGNEVEKEKRRDKTNKKDKGGKGILALWHRAGVTDPNLWAPLSEKIFDKIEDARSKDGIIDISDMPESVSKALQENAFEARKYEIAKYVQNKFFKENNSKLKTIDMGTITGSRDDDTSGEVYGKSSSQLDDVGDYEGEPGVVKPEDIMKMTGKQIQKTPEVQPTIDPKITKSEIGPNEPKKRATTSNNPRNKFVTMIKIGRGQSKQNAAPAPAPAPAATGVKSLFMTKLRGDRSKRIISSPIKQNAPAAPAAGVKSLFMTKLRGNTRKSTLVPMLKEISVVFDPSEKPHDGCGWNWEGAPGKIGGTSITGDADTAKSDPTGKKGMKHGRKKPK